MRRHTLGLAFSQKFLPHLPQHPIVGVQVNRGLSEMQDPKLTNADRNDRNGSFAGQVERNYHHLDSVSVTQTKWRKGKVNPFKRCPKAASSCLIGRQHTCASPQQGLPFLPLILLQPYWRLGSKSISRCRANLVSSFCYIGYYIG